VTRRLLDRGPDGRLAAGAFALKVSRPLAAHALRELESTLRHVLKVPLEAVASEQPENTTRLKEVRKQLKEMDFDESAIQRAMVGLKPKFNQKTEIREIVARLGLDPEGDIANRWTSLCDTFGKAHQRSFHRSLEVDDEFRSQYQQPFDTVVRAVAVALEGRYTAFMRRVEELAAMPNRAQAVAAFASEIPGTFPLQRHFYERLQTGDWLPHLAKEGLLGEPLTGPDDDSSAGMRFRQWSVGNYLLRMAQSADAATREAVTEALCNVGSSKHPDVQNDGLEILAALPPAESAPLAELAVSWLSPGARNWPMQTPETLVKKLAEGQQGNAALQVARALLQLWDQNGRLASHYAHHMYEYHLPALVTPLSKCCGEDALHLLADLLQLAATITGKIDYGHHSMRQMGDDGMANHDIYESLISAVRRSAEILIQQDARRMGGVVRALAGYPPKIFTRLYLYVLASNPAAAPDLATTYLTDSELIEASWCRDEYAKLASAWFPSLTREDQAKVLAVIDSLPDKYLAAWKRRFEEHMKKAPNAEDERKFRAATSRDLVWKWRAALPAPRQKALERIVKELGDPDAWKEQLFPPDESPLTGTDFSSRPIPEIVALLKSWRPGGENSLQTVTGLAQELRIAVSNNPEAYADHAEQFSGLKPIYVRQVFEALAIPVSNRVNFEWGSVLKLIETTLAQFGQRIDPSTIFDGDDRTWTWACMKAGELLAAGLRHGAAGIAFEHADQVSTIILSLIRLAPKDPEIEDFEERYKREPFFAAQATLRGLAIELCILMMFWLSKDSSGPLRAEPRKALSNSPDIRNFLENELSDRSPSGRIPRAVMGRFLCYLFYFGEEWLKAHLDALFPSADQALRRAAWHAHIGHDQQPIVDLVPQLHPCFAEEIARLSDRDGEPDGDFHRERFADYLMIVHLWGGLPNDLLASFSEQAPIGTRQHAMWYLGTQLALRIFPTRCVRGASHTGNGASKPHGAPIILISSERNWELSGNGVCATGSTIAGWPISCSPWLKPDSSLPMHSASWNGSRRSRREM
jgi:hypothetical protein